MTRLIFYPSAAWTLPLAAPAPRSHAFRLTEDVIARAAWLLQLLPVRNLDAPRGRFRAMLSAREE